MANAVGSVGPREVADVAAALQQIQFPAYSIDLAVVAAGTSQATATLLKKSINVITAGSGGVVLPLSSIWVGAVLTIVNRLALGLVIYPPVGGKLDGGTLNLSLPLLTGSVKRVLLTTADGQWLSV